MGQVEGLTRAIGRLAGRRRGNLVWAWLIALAAMLVGCDDDPSSPDPVVATVQVSPESAVLRPGGTEMFTATAWSGALELPVRDITWSTSDTLVAVVSASGEVTARAEGEAVLRATVAGVTGTAELIVELPAPGPAAVLELNTDSMRVREGDHPVFEATARDSSGTVITGRAIHWSSSDPSTATINAQGAASALRPGTVMITATLDSVTATARLVVWADHPFDLLYSGWGGVPGEAPELFRVDVRTPGAAAVRVPIDDLAVSDAVPSPDGRTLVFAGNRYAAGGGLFLANIDGSGIRRLTSDPFDDQPAWSPDGQRIAFRRWHFAEEEDADIWVVSPDGTGAVNLTDGLGSTHQSWPSWSPEEEGELRIAFSHATGGAAHIWIMNDDGWDAEAITAGAVWDEQPAWSPDGQNLAFQRTEEGTTSDLYLVGAWGGAVRRLFQSGELAGSQWTPAWSPDGSLIAFTSRHEGLGPDSDDYQVYTVDLMGERVARRTADPTDKTRPVWIRLAEQ